MYVTMDLQTEFQSQIVEQSIQKHMVGFGRLHLLIRSINVVKRTRKQSQSSGCAFLCTDARTAKGDKTP